VGELNFSVGLRYDYETYHTRILFLARDSMLSALYAIARQSVSLSACPSHGWIIQKRLKLGSWNIQHTVALSLSFLRGKFHPEILRGSPSGASNDGGVGKISHFLALSVNISKTVADTAKVTINHSYEVACALSIGTKIGDLGW